MQNGNSHSIVGAAQHLVEQLQHIEGWAHTAASRAAELRQQLQTLMGFAPHSPAAEDVQEEKAVGEAATGTSVREKLLAAVETHGLDYAALAQETYGKDTADNRKRARANLDAFRRKGLIAVKGDVVTVTARA
jgi:hypothetical protein